MILKLKTTKHMEKHKVNNNTPHTHMQQHNTTPQQHPQTQHHQLQVLTHHTQTHGTQPKYTKQNERSVEQLQSLIKETDAASTEQSRHYYRIQEDQWK